MSHSHGSLSTRPLVSQIALHVRVVNCITAHVGFASNQRCDNPCTARAVFFLVTENCDSPVALIIWQTLPHRQRTRINMDKPWIKPGKLGGETLTSHLKKTIDKPWTVSFTSRRCSARLMDAFSHADLF